MAGAMLFFYTLFASLPLLLFIFLLVSVAGVRDMFQLKGERFSRLRPSLFFMLCAAFLVKFPMYGVHLWLPKAHVEAPVAGSMILAGVLLKLGGYGIIRLAPVLLVKFSLGIMFRVVLVGGGILRV